MARKKVADSDADPHGYAFFGSWAWIQIRIRVKNWFLIRIKVNILKL
jgi:hypothetical protein